MKVQEIQKLKLNATHKLIVYGDDVSIKSAKYVFDVNKKFDLETTLRKF